MDVRMRKQEVTDPKTNQTLDKIQQETGKPEPKQRRGNRSIIMRERRRNIGQAETQRKAQERKGEEETAEEQHRKEQEEERRALPDERAQPEKIWKGKTNQYLAMAKEGIRVNSSVCVASASVCLCVCGFF